MADDSYARDEENFEEEEVDETVSVYQLYHVTIIGDKDACSDPIVI
jgi:hypothetical protein